MFDGRAMSDVYFGTNADAGSDPATLEFGRSVYQYMWPQHEIG